MLTKYIPKLTKILVCRYCWSSFMSDLMLKIDTQSSVIRAYIWLNLHIVSVVKENICVVRILYRDFSDSPYLGTNYMIYFPLDLSVINKIHYI